MDNEGVKNAETVNTNSITSEHTPKQNLLKSFLEKLGKSPLFMGKRKFIVIPLLLLALTSLIVLVVVLITGLTSDPEPPVVRVDDAKSSFASEVIEVRGSQWHRDLYSETRSLIKDGRLDEAFDLLDDKIAAETNDATRSIIILEKSYIAASAGRLDVAKAAANDQIEIFRANNENLESSYGYLASLYEQSGDIDRAIEYYQLAVDNSPPTSVEIGYYQVKIIELSGAENE